MPESCADGGCIMRFDVLKVTRSFGSGFLGRTTDAITLEVTPSGREHLDIGEKHAVCRASYLPLRKERILAEASVTILTDPTQLDHVKGEKPICGYAQFFKERAGHIDSSPPALSILIVVKPEIFNEMASVKIHSAAVATLQIEIEGLEFGWEPDGSHRTWNLEDASDCEMGARRRVSSFSCSVETFWTTEGAIQAEEDRKMNAILRESPDRENRKLAAPLQGLDGGGDVARLLGHCRAALLALLAVGLWLLVRR